MKMRSLVSSALAGLTLLCCSPVLGATCVTTACHSGIAATTYPHAPVKEGDCSSCHTPLSKEHPVKGVKGFALAEKGGALCTKCHDGMGAKPFQHQPVKDGDCVSCHKPHGSNERFLLEAGEDRTPLCLGCHDGEPFKQKYMHGPAAVGSCNACHDPHESNDKLLLKGPIKNLCLGCHADFAATLQAAAFVHPPVKNEPCTVCHNPHGSSALMFLRKKMPDLCVECHKDIGKKLTGVKFPHKPLTQEGGCTNCHSGHYSKAKALLSADEMTICLNCHGKDNLGTLKNIKTQIEGKKYLHGPIQKGSCKACHDPHGSDFFRMLPGNYPAQLYGPYVEGMYNACLTCHDKNMLRFEETSLYTKFRNGKRNLHYVHVVNRKSRSCRICHEPHASDEVRLLRKEGAPFGEWKIPLNFKVSDNGGGCAPGCHKAFKYDRVTPQVYR